MLKDDGTKNVFGKIILLAIWTNHRLWQLLFVHESRARAFGVTVCMVLRWWQIYFGRHLPLGSIGWSLPVACLDARSYLGCLICRAAGGNYGEICV